MVVRIATVAAIPRHINPHSQGVDILRDSQGHSTDLTVMVRQEQMAALLGGDLPRLSGPGVVNAPNSRHGNGK